MQRLNKDTLRLIIPICGIIFSCMMITVSNGVLSAFKTWPFAS